MQGQLARVDDPVSVTYDGFISYSHAADGLLAPRLQSALQRFAKPWWKRRAVRIFRDESSLSANPHLWSSITEALDTSGWFVLLLSPDAAQSEWVNQEISYWVETRDSKKILPVVTDGRFAWSGTDVSGDAVPDSLLGVFSEEPRWVDVRWAKDEDQLDLKDPRFADAIADIASTIRGVPKDDLASEEVRQHRRTVRTAWAGVALVTTLAVAAVGFGVDASNERDRANRLAEQEAAARDEAESSAAQAAANAESEAVARADADAQARLAKARELAASSISVRESDPELATLLSLEAMRVAGEEGGLFAEGLITLRESIYSNALITRRSLPQGGSVDVTFTPDGSGLIVTSELDQSVSLLDVDDIDGEPVWEHRDSSTNDMYRRAVPHPDGEEVAVIVVDRGPDDGRSGRIVLLDAATGSVVRTVELDGCVEPVAGNYSDSNRSGFSSTGAWFHLLVQDTECAVDPRVELQEGQTGFWDTVILETSNWTEVRRVGRPNAIQFGEVSFTADDSEVLVSFEFDRVELRSFPEFELLTTFDTGVLPFAPATARISPDGQFFAFSMANFGDTRPGFWDIDRDSFLGWGDSFRGLASDSVFNADGTVLVYGSDATVLYDPATAIPLAAFPTKGAQAAAGSPDGTLVATAGLAGDIELWTTETAPELVAPSGNRLEWINPNEIVIDGEHVAVRAFADPAGVFVIDTMTGEVTEEFQTWAADILPDGRLVMSLQEERVVPDGDQGETETWEGPLTLLEVDTGSTHVLQDCVGSTGGGILYRVGEPKCPNGDPLFTTTVSVSWDGSSIAGMAVGGEVRIWDAETLDVVRTIDAAAGDALLHFGDGWFLTGPRTDTFFAAEALYVIDAQSGELVTELRRNWRWGTSELSRDGARLFIMEDGGRVFEYDTATWEVIRDWQAQASNARGIALSRDGTELAVSGEDGLIAIWDIEGAEPRLIQRIPAMVERISDILWIDDHSLGAALVANHAQVMWQVIDVTSEVVVDKAVAGLVRGLTESECDTYRIDPCPTLDEMRSR